MSFPGSSKTEDKIFDTNISFLFFLVDKLRIHLIYLEPKTSPSIPVIWKEEIP